MMLLSLFSNVSWPLVIIGFFVVVIVLSIFFGNYDTELMELPSYFLVSHDTNIEPVSETADADKVLEPNEPTPAPEEPLSTGEADRSGFYDADLEWQMLSEAKNQLIKEREEFEAFRQNELLKIKSEGVKLREKMNKYW